MILYKVVEKSTRKGTNWAASGYTKDTLREQFDYGDLKELKKYLKRYLKGTIVEADKSTIGLLLFKTFRAASCFMANNQLSYDYYKIITVEPLGKIKKSPVVLMGGSGLLGWIYDEQMDTMSAPNGTVSCYKVKVLE